MGYPLHGKTCNFTVDGATGNNVASLNEWEIDVTAEFESYGEFNDTFMSKIGGMVDWKGTMSGYFDTDDTYQKELHDLIVAASPAFELTDGRWNMDTGDYYSGTILIVGFRTGASINAIVPVTFTFEGSGALTFTTA